MKQELFLFTLPNGKTFKIIDAGKYVDGEYPKGGLEIWARQINGEYVYIDSSPDMKYIKNFLKMSGYKGY